MTSSCESVREPSPLSKEVVVFTSNVVNRCVWTFQELLVILKLLALLPFFRVLEDEPFTE